MMKRVLVGVVMAAGAASPAFALKHDVVIDHAAGPIIADYRGSVTVETKQVGTAGVAGRPTTLSCQWTASLHVDRVAKVGAALQSIRKLTSEEVTGGSKPGWCPTNPKSLERFVDASDVRFKAALLALVDQDRATLLAEADNAKATIRG